MGLDSSGAPALGNAAFFAVEGHQGLEEERRLLIRPKLPETARDRRAESYYGQSSNIQVFLLDAPTLNLKVRLAPPEKAVFQVFVSIPDRDRAVAMARQEIETERAQLERRYEARVAQLDSEVEVRAFGRMLDALAERFECRDLSGRSMRDFLVFRTRSICRIGRRIFIHFLIKNRRRASVFHFDEIIVSESRRDPSVGSLEVDVRFERPEPAVVFGDSIKGVLGFQLPEDSRQFGPWHLVLVEDGGANRRVTIEDVGF